MFFFRFAPNVLFLRTKRSFSSHQTFFFFAPNVLFNGVYFIERKKRKKETISKNIEGAFAPSPLVKRKIFFFLFFNATECPTIDFKRLGSINCHPGHRTAQNGFKRPLRRFVYFRSFQLVISPSKMSSSAAATASSIAAAVCSLCCISANISFFCCWSASAADNSFS